MLNSINSTFGTSFEIEKLDKIDGLPIYMSARRTFYEMKDGEAIFLLVKVSDSEKFGVISYEKQRDKYEDKTNMPVAFWFEDVTRSQRDSLVRHHVSFVSNDNQLYLPFLGMALHNAFKKKANIKSEKMMPATQCLFLFLAYKCKDKKVMKKQAAEYLGVTQTTITRASAQLKEMGLIRQENSGKECYMWTEECGYDLFLKAKKYLINPVRRSYTVKINEGLQKLPLAGESALAEYSMMNPPEIVSLAIDKALVNEYELKNAEERWEDEDTLAKLELWKYSPVKFSKSGLVDPISLYMTLAETQDERIEGAIEQMMEEYEW